MSKPIEHTPPARLYHVFNAGNEADIKARGLIATHDDAMSSHALDVNFSNTPAAFKRFVPPPHRVAVVNTADLPGYWERMRDFAGGLTWWRYWDSVPPHLLTIPRTATVNPSDRGLQKRGESQ
jgi:hypothetical protein